MNQHIKGSLSTIILKLLHDNGRMYGYEITQKVKEITQEDIQITEGALYPILHKFEAEEILMVIDQIDQLAFCLLRPRVRGKYSFVLLQQQLIQ